MFRGDVMDIGIKTELYKHFMRLNEEERAGSVED